MAKKAEQEKEKDMQHQDTEGAVKNEAKSAAGSGKQSQGKTKKESKSAIDKKKAAIVKLQAELKEQQDRYLRLSAEFDNYRKRTLKEKVDLTKFAGEGIFTSLLPVLDNLDRALAHVNEASDMDAVRQGIELIINKFREYLTSQGIKEIAALHEELDTDLHEAVTKTPVQEKKLKGKIVDVIEKGYLLNEKVIRYAKVVIGE